MYGNVISSSSAAEKLHPFAKVLRRFYLEVVMPTPLTHAVVGGAVGGIVALVIRGLGGEMDVFSAMTVGAISGALPDIDSIFEPFADHTMPRSGLFRHRGITHSMVVMPFLAALVVPLLFVSVPLWSYEYLQWGIVVDPLPMPR